MLRRFIALVLATLAAAALAAPALAADPGRWTLTRVSEIPLLYYQGVTASPARDMFFSGHLGVFRTTATLDETGRNLDVIPPEVKAVEGYNHIGDLDHDDAEGGRLLLPLECYYPGTPNGGNTCPRTGSIGTGSIGVVDAATLAWRYYVKLAQAEIKKAMWAETTPDGSLWTQDGDDLLRFRLADITAANATVVGLSGATGPEIAPVQRLPGAVPPSGISGATFHEGRLYVAGQNAAPTKDVFQVWSIDLADGSRRLEIERRIVGESEGLATIQTLGGVLHWQVMPYNTSGPPTYGPNRGVLLTFAPRGAGGRGNAPAASPTAAAGRAALRMPAGCVGARLRAAVAGRHVSRAALFVDGRRVGVLRGRRMLRARIDVRGLARARRHTLVARVRFTRAGWPPRVLRGSFRRCRAPRFAG